MNEETEDLSGRYFGRLRVLRSAPAAHLCGCARWRCQCECGGVIDAFHSALVQGLTTSCGCQSQVKQRRVIWDGEQIAHSIQLGLRTRYLRRLLWWDATANLLTIPPS